MRKGGGAKVVGIGLEERVSSLEWVDGEVVSVSRIVVMCVGMAMTRFVGMAEVKYSNLDFLG